MQHLTPARKVPTVDLVVQASKRLRGTVRCPPNKSHSFRALIMAALAEATRSSNEFAMPVSTRGVQNLYWAAQALALCEGRDYAVPDDVQRLAVPVLGHRVMLRRGSGGLAETQGAVRHLLATTPVPL